MKRTAARVAAPGSVSGAAPAPSAITNFRGDYHFLSNFYKSPIERDGLVFPTVEHAFQAAKCLDQAGKLLVLANKSPVVAKRVGRRVQLRPDWERVKLDIMHDVLAIKFAPGGPLSPLLLATGEAELVEGNRWHDDFWGCCQCDKHRATAGKNHVGKLLMRVRDELRQQQRQRREGSSSGSTENGNETESPSTQQPSLSP